ncbi:MAG: hypothetical protein KatS3mg131_0827 [Candidatus Tectimicrobiota bacterium]|nr:MAG: hypothetical protein KatS3mg131_0827 [Candidatus Tectomicrobia bacterium]
MSSFLFFLFVMLGAALLQTSPLLFSVGGGWRVDLLLLVVVYASLFWGEQQALVVGFCAGLGQDALSSELLGTHALSKTLSAFVILSLRRHVHVQSLVAQELLTLTALLTDTAARLALMAMVHVPLWSLAVLAPALLQQLGLSVLLAPLVCQGLHLLTQPLRISPKHGTERVVT